MFAKIVKLDEVVVNRIAAGEVVQRPFNALKEMMENCLDAEATSINITVKEGGLKLLQIQDNGIGIQKDDLDIVCERFTTSKLRKFEDLLDISTFGFRGEALASISHVAHVTIISRCADSKCAFKVTYMDGKPKEQPKPCAGNQGTQIMVEDLFYNVPTRRKAFRNPSEEYGKIVDVVSRYAVHNPKVGFGLKKHGESRFDVRTSPGTSVLDNIRIMHGVTVARELLSFNCEDNLLKIKCTGLVSNANFSLKKTTFILFINDRHVESTALRKAIEEVYSNLLPKHGFPFVYISLHIAPQHVDVNVHPTKHTVHFLYEDKVMDKIQQSLDTCLKNCDTSRTMYVQSILPQCEGIFTSNISALPSTSKQDKSTANPVVKYPHQVTRTDSKEKKLDSYLFPTSSPVQMTIKSSGKEPLASKDNVPHEEKVVASASTSCESRNCMKTFTNMTKSRNIMLSSVKLLNNAIKESCHSGLQKLFKDHFFVGCVNRHLALVQHETKLFLINTTRLSEELFYQIMINDFGNFGIIRFSSPLPLFALAALALESEEAQWTEADGTKEELANNVQKLLITKVEMLNDYFSLHITKDGNLLSIPYLLENYSPSAEGLPLFILRLATEVDWETEKECFETICRETARYYAFPKVGTPLTDVSSVVKQSEEALQKDKQSNAVEPWKWVVEHILYATMKSSLLPPKELSQNGSILEIANLPDLYKVFERC